jgi:hypothetical protein
MPPFREKLSADQLNAMVLYVRSLGGIKPIPREDPSAAFDLSFRRLMGQMEELKREYRALASTASTRALVAQSSRRSRDAKANPASEWNVESKPAAHGEIVGSRENMAKVNMRR